MRKNKIIIVPLMLVGFLWFGSSLTVAQISPATNSFRNASTAGLLEDDLELMVGLYGYLDPARIPLIDGKRLYTSLSNFVTKQEELFNNNGNEYFLIGGKSDIRRGLSEYGSLGLLYDRAAFKSPLYVGFSDVDGNPIFGQGQRDEVRRYDRDEDLYQEEEHEITRKGTNYEYWRGWDHLVGFGKYVGNMKVGVVYLRKDNYSQWPTTTVIDSSITNRVTASTIYTYSKIDSSTFEMKNLLNFFGLSLWRPQTEKIDLGLALGIGILSNMASQTNRTVKENWERPTLETYSYTREDKDTEEWPGNLFDGRLAAIYKWSDATQTRCDLGFAHSSSKIKSGAKVERSNSTVYTGINPYTWTWTSGGPITQGKAGNNELAVLLKTVSKLSKKVTFGIGLWFWTGNGDSTGVYKNDYSETYSLRINGNPVDPNSYVETITRTETWEHKRTYANTTIQIPVCVEFNLTNAIVFRIGARHDMENSDMTLNKTLTSSTAELTHRVYGDGRIEDAVQDYNVPVASSETQEEKSTYTSYFYGAGWNYSKNLQLDFMGFANLTNLTNWRLSATLKF
ncbi:MAG: hypothetical protein AB1393_12475 [Candidatus Edwardsbacteria bacterium]